jgi:uncharacterized protein YjiS (DUF1127 family)
MNFPKAGAEKLSFVETCIGCPFVRKTLFGSAVRFAGAFRRPHMSAIHLQACVDRRCPIARRRRAAAAALDLLRDAAEWIFTILREWRRRSRERDQLARFDERMLLDIGLTRADAEFMVNKPFWRK